MIIILFNTYSEKITPLKERKLISKKFDWDNNILVTINQINYKKETYPKSEIGDVMTINIQELYDFFLNKAVEVSGIEINYSFLYEYAYVSGIISTRDINYEFYYNLAGFCYIKNTSNDSSIIIADPNRVVPMVDKK